MLRVDAAGGSPSFLLTQQHIGHSFATPNKATKQVDPGGSERIRVCSKDRRDKRDWIRENQWEKGL